MTQSSPPPPIPAQCGSCLEFRSDYRCACGMVLARHKTVVESGEGGCGKKEGLWMIGGDGW